MQLRNKQDFWSGAMFIALGLGFAWKASQYQMGTSARMGPGYFPFWLGMALALLGLVVLLSAMAKKADKTEVAPFDWRILLLVIGSVVLYALVLHLLGVYASVFLLVMVSSLASHEFNWKVAVANALFLVAFAYLAFIKGLGLIFPLWPSFLGMN
ncbi:MAG TPA: tripartite tricarboxylate transporter TctB family protein [Bordetella sp.]